MALSSSNLGGSAHLNNVIGGALDVGAAIVMMALLKKFSRRNTLASLFAAFALFSITSPFVKSGEYCNQGLREGGSGGTSYPGQGLGGARAQGARKSLGFRVNFWFRTITP